MEEGFLDSRKYVLVLASDGKVRVLGYGSWIALRPCMHGGEMGGEQVDRTYFAACPSLSSTVFIWERRSGSCVVSVYVEAAFGTRTGVVGSDAIVYSFPWFRFVNRFVALKTWCGYPC